MQSYAQLARAFSSHSSSIDVAMLDVVWPGAFAPVPGQPEAQALGSQAKNARGRGSSRTTRSTASWSASPGSVTSACSTTAPTCWRSTATGPPETWDELGAEAKKIVDGEKGSNPNFNGFVFQGNAYEGLTCNALEWIAPRRRHDRRENKQVTLNNPQAAAISNKGQGLGRHHRAGGRHHLPGGRGPQRLRRGNAAFMRNWPYMYSSFRPPLAVKASSTWPSLPHGSDNSGTVGGWQIAVSKYSKNKDAAIEFVRYMTSPKSEVRAIVTERAGDKTVAEDPQSSRRTRTWSRRWRLHA